MAKTNRAAEAFKKVKERKDLEKSIQEEQEFMYDFKLNEFDFLTVIDALRELEQKKLRDLSREIGDIEQAKIHGAYVFMINQLIHKLS